MANIWFSPKTILHEKFKLTKKLIDLTLQVYILIAKYYKTIENRF